MAYSEAWPTGPKFIRTDAAPLLTTDTVLLADFVRLRGGNGLCGDIGTGSGALILLLAEKHLGYKFCGFELSSDAAKAANANLELNGLSGRAEIITGDITETCALFGRGSFDSLVSNPPYFPADSNPSPNTARNYARRGLEPLELCRAASYLLKNGGFFSLVYRTERLAELFRAMSDNLIEPKRLKLFAKNEKTPPSLALVEGRIQAKAGLKIEPALFQKNGDDSETDEYLRINHR